MILSYCTLNRIVGNYRVIFRTPSHMSAKLLSTASEEVELVMIEENGATTPKVEYARKVRIYHQMKALVSPLTTPPPLSPSCKLARNLGSVG